jgi:hypothetical protein
MSTCRDMRCTAAAHVTARQARDASKYFSVAPDHVLSCTESVETLCYLSRLVYGLPTFHSGDFSSPPKFPRKWESRKHQHQNGVASTEIPSPVPQALHKPRVANADESHSIHGMNQLARHSLSHTTDIAAHGLPEQSHDGAESRVTMQCPCIGCATL